ncbi:hypothetical protein BKA82DRAFT_4145316 [Pisolithus tinctorius]|nr:hypothetical protein BKA82DRAFT_4145316 [Pisolithus tinctorius]
MLASPYPGTINDFRFPSLPPSSVLYDSRNKQTHNLESSLQRRERIEFLKKREWTRRVAELVKYSHIQQLNDPTLGRAWPLSPKPVQDTGYAHSASYASPVSFPVEEEEPYIIYSSSPSPSPSPLLPGDPKSTGAASPVSPSMGNVFPRHASAHHRRRSSASTRAPRRSPSLSSIFEVPEED